MNGVFLVALCLSIFLEAIQRFVEPQTVTQPQTILIVGCLGLASNIMGLFLFHDHGHGNGHDHEHNEEQSGYQSLCAAENGHVQSPADEETNNISDPSGNIVDILPQSVVGVWSSNNVKLDREPRIPTEDSSKRLDRKGSGPSSPDDPRKTSFSNSQSIYRRSESASHPRYSSFSEPSLRVHPVFLRNDIINRGSEFDVPSPIMSEGESDLEFDRPSSNENQPLLSHDKRRGDIGDKSAEHKKRSLSIEFKHDNHNHRGLKKQPQSHGHSHGDLNMRGVFLHVMGDALGNVGVIATALFIWLTDFSWRFYSDPAISLVITVIILCSAIPLCRAASRILLQAAPAGVSIDEIKEDIEKLPGVISCHHIHVWQLSDTKLVASLHVMLAFDFQGVGKQEYMRLSSAIRTCLKEYGIRNPTIQAEFCLDDSHIHEADGSISPKDNPNITDNTSNHGASKACAWECGDKGATCCPPDRKT